MAETAIRNSDVWTAVNIISTDVARTYFHTAKKAVDKLLDSPSVLTNRFSFYQSMVAQLLLSGNSYALRRTSADGKGEWWEFIPPSNVTVWLADDGQSLSYDINFSNPHEENLKFVDASDVIHLRWSSMNGGITGQSPLVSLSNELALQNQASKLGLSALSRAITPTSILSTDKARLSKDERETAREQFEAANTGDNAGRTLVLDSLFSYSSVEVNADVAKILSSADYTRQQIAKAFMIPASYLGEEASSSNLDMVRAQYNQTFGRYLSAIVEELESKLDCDIFTDTHNINDLDGTGMEARVIALVTAGVIDAATAQNILAESQSDILDENMVNKLALIDSVSDLQNGGQDDNSGN
jgi:HK97 family phage portal protein